MRLFLFKLKRKFLHFMHEAYGGKAKDCVACNKDWHQVEKDLKEFADSLPYRKLRNKDNT